MMPCLESIESFGNEINPDFTFLNFLEEIDIPLYEAFTDDNTNPKNEKEYKDANTQLKRKKGRIKNTITNQRTNQRIHDNSDEDNIISKIQVSYINFLQKMINKILISIGRKGLLFLPLNHNCKKIITQNYRNELNSGTIEDILRKDISGRYKTKNRDYNANICEQIKKEKINLLQNILNQNFLFFFDKIYYKSNKKINMKEFGFTDLEIDLKDIELFGDLLKKVKGDNSLKEKMNLCAQKNFMPENKYEIFRCMYY